MSYSKKQVEEITGLDSRQIQFYTKEGVVTPLSGGGKRGQSFKYSQKNLVEFGIIKQLFGYGMTVKKIQHIISKINSRQLFIMYFDESGTFSDDVGFDISMQVPLLGVYDGGETIEIHRHGVAEFQDPKGIRPFLKLQNHTSLILIRLDEIFKSAI